ncbi:hypothetical protein Tco_0126486 [Tanacetum coccineum]
MSGEAHPLKCCEGCPHENEKETSGNCPDKKKVNGETDDCSRKNGKNKAKEGSGHVREALTKEEQEREMLVYDPVNVILGFDIGFDCNRFIGLYGPTNGEDMVNIPRVDAKVMDHSQEVHDSSNGESVSSFSHKVHNGGSILNILDDMVRVGHSMGYNLDGCLKDMEPLLGSQGDEDVLK